MNIAKRIGETPTRNYNEYFQINKPNGSLIRDYLEERREQLRQIVLEVSLHEKDGYSKFLQLKDINYLLLLERYNLELFHIRWKELRSKWN